MTEPEDTCRPVEVDGEIIRVRGSGEFTEQERQFAAEIVRAAKAKMAAEPPPIRQQVRAAAFNAVAPALKRHDEWLRLTVRRSIANAVLAAIEEHLDFGDADAWCKTCRRVWNGPDHRCESDAEQRLAAIRDALAAFNGRGVISVGHANFDIPTAGEVIAAVRQALEQPTGTAPDNPTISEEN